jgi:proteic killer suppression protein
MIRDFYDKETERVWNGERSRKLPPDTQPNARRKLFQIDAAGGRTIYAYRVVTASKS